MADLLSKTLYMEKVGTGIQRIRDSCLKNGNKVEFRFSDAFWVEIRSVDKVGEKSSEKSSEKGSEKSSEKILDIIRKEPYITIEKLSDAIGLSTRAVEKQISRLKEEGSLRRIGGRKEGHWEVL